MTTVATLKETEVPETPLILFECELPSGRLENWSTHQVTAEGRVYEARVVRHNLFEMTAGAEGSIEGVGRISLTLANADSYFSQLTRNGEWKGGKLTARFVFFDLRARQAASESMVLFRGVIDGPDEITEATLRLSVLNRFAVQRIQLPEVRIQRRCPWVFPATRPQREEAVAGGARGK